MLFVSSRIRGDRRTLDVERSPVTGFPALDLTTVDIYIDDDDDEMLVVRFDSYRD